MADNEVSPLNSPKVFCKVLDRFRLAIDRGESHQPVRWDYNVARAGQGLAKTPASIGQKGLHRNRATQRFGVAEPPEEARFVAGLFSPARLSLAFSREVLPPEA